MVTSLPEIEDVEDVIRFIPENDFEYYDYLDKEDIRDGHVCDCDKGKFLSGDDRHFYSRDKTGIGECSNCGGFFGYLRHNW
jgi:hypothetical protein